MLRSNLRIVLIGSGNVATHLAKALRDAGNEIVQVYSRTLENARVLGEGLSAKFTDNIQDIDPSADIYIFSVKDDVIAEILSAMPSTKGVWVHTAGSVPMDVFASYTKNFGIIYPLQTFSKKREINFSEVPVFIEGSSDSVCSILENLAKSISQNVRFLSGEKRRHLHLAAVFACNFTNHMYVLAEEIIGKENIPFDVLNPLIDETAAKVKVISPKQAQTGPAVRFDEEVMEKHRQLMVDGEVKEIYKLLSKSIHKRK